MSDFKYNEKDLTGGWCIEVRKGPFPVGNIRKNPSNGAFQYYPGMDNILTWKFEERSLDTLKQKIEQTV